jgi:hypothetical protein
MKNNGIPLSHTPLGALIMLGFMFFTSFIFFMLLASNYIPLFFGEKIQSTVVGVDSIYHMPRNKYRYDYFAVFEYSKKDIKEKIAITSYSAKKAIIEEEIGQKREIYYQKGFGVIDPKGMFLSNAMMIVLFIIWFVIGLFFYAYFKEKRRRSYRY